SLGCRRADDEPPSMTTPTIRAPEDGDEEREPQAVDAGGEDLVPGDTPEAREMRHRLVRSIASFDRPWGDDATWNPRVLDAMRRVPRHLFMPAYGIVSAYRDMPFPIGHGQTISQPTVVALM